MEWILEVVTTMINPLDLSLTNLLTLNVSATLLVDLSLIEPKNNVGF